MVNGSAPDLVLLLGRLDERTATTVHQLARIDARLATGDTRMATLEETVRANGTRIERTEQRIIRLERSRPRGLVPRAEKLIKRWAPVWAPAAALAATGQHQAALDALKIALGH